MTFSCPLCEYQNPKGSSSCARCLVVFEKYERKVRGEGAQISGSGYLLELWSHVISDYGNKDFHEKFIQTALAEKNLPFASQQYRKMTDLNPADDIAIKMKDKILQLAVLTLIPTARPSSKENGRKNLGPSILFKIFLFLMVIGFFILLFGRAFIN